MKDVSQGSHSYQLDQVRLSRAAKSLAELLGGLIETVQQRINETEPIRNRILVDLRELQESVPPRDRGIILSALATEVQGAFDQAGSPKVNIDGGCLKRPGAGITATEGNVTVKACVIGSLQEGIKGGGIEVSTTC